MESTRSTDILEQWDTAREADPTLTPLSFVVQRFGSSDSAEASRALKVIHDFEKGRGLANLFATDGSDSDELSEGPIGKRLLPGQQPVGGYELVRRLGSGGYGEVWEAIGPGGFPVAMKFIGSNSPGSEQLRELEIAKQAKHPNLIATHGAWRLDGCVAVAMELADQTLGDHFRDRLDAGHNGIERNELLRFLSDAASGIDFLNGTPHKIQHRDIKPDNVLLVGGGAKVADFGISRIVSGDSTGHTGAMTVAYSAPETFDGRTSRHSDQYSLAIVYVYLLTGIFPFSGTPQQIMRGHISGAADLGKLSESDRVTVAKALSKNPSERWASCTDFIRTLAKPGNATPATPLSRRTKRPLTYALSALCVVVLLPVGWQLFAVHDRTPLEEVSSAGAAHHSKEEVGELADQFRKPAPKSVTNEIRAMSESITRMGQKTKDAVPGTPESRKLWASDENQTSRVMEMLVDALRFKTQPAAEAGGPSVNVLMQIDEEGYARLSSTICESLQRDSISSGEALLGFGTSTLDPIIRHDLLDGELNEEIVEALSNRTQCVVIVASEFGPSAWGNQEDTDLRRGRGGHQTANAKWFTVADKIAAPIQQAFRQLRLLKLEPRDSASNRSLAEPIGPFEWESSHGREDTSFLPGGPAGKIFSPGTGGGSLSIIGARTLYETTLGRNPSDTIPLDEERVALILPKFIYRGEFAEQVIVGKFDDVDSSELNLVVDMRSE